MMVSVVSVTVSVAAVVSHHLVFASISRDRSSYVDVQVVTNLELCLRECLVIVFSFFTAACDSDLSHSVCIRAIIRKDECEIKVGPLLPRLWIDIAGTFFTIIGS
jgi:hypothetical protein